MANNDFIKQRIWCLNTIRCPIHYKIYTCLPTFLVFLSIHELIICKLENHTTHQTANLSLMSVHRTKTTLLCFQCGLPDPPAAEPFLFHACPFISAEIVSWALVFFLLKAEIFFHILYPGYRSPPFPPSFGLPPIPSRSTLFLYLVRKQTVF